MQEEREVWFNDVLEVVLVRDLRESEKESLQVRELVVRVVQVMNRGEQLDSMLEDLS